MSAGALYQRAWRRANPELAAKHRENAKERMHEWYSSNKASFRKAKMAKYGTTPEVVTQAFADQKGLCAICGRPPVVNKRGGLHVDHDHSAKKFRALLCNNCNLMLGHAKDDPARLRAAADYLEKHRKL